MKKKLLVPALLLTAASVFAQTPRLSLYEEFTGETCPPCASTNPGLDAKLTAATNTPLVEFIKWQVPIPSAPSNTWSLYRTNKAEIDWRYRSTSGGGYGYPSQNSSTTTVTSGINSAPSGRIDGRHQWEFGVTSDHPTYVSNTMISNAQAIMAPFSVVMVKAWDGSMTSVNVTVNIVASMNYTATGALVFRTVMIERLVQFSVQPGTNGEKTFHNPVIASFPSIQAGTPLASAWVTGQSFSFTLNCPAPSYTRDKNQVDMVGFIQDDGSRKIEQSVRGSTCAIQNITAVSNRTSVCNGQSATLTASGSGNYVWSDGQTGNSVVVSPTATKNYWVKSGNPGDCPNIAALSVKVISCTGLSGTIAEGVQISVYPNPNNGEFTIDAGEGSDNSSIVLFNAVGQKVFEQTLTAGENSIKTKLAGGLYYYKVVNASQTIGAGKLLVK